MPDISTELLSIQNDTRGELVRDSFVSAIDKINYYGLLTIDDEPKPSSIHPAKSGGIYNAIRQAELAVDTVQVTLSTAWLGNNPYYQSVEIENITEYTKIDIQKNSSLIQQLEADDITALWFVNDNGTVQAYSLGAAPSVGLVLTCELSEGVE